ncbi:MAG: ATPase [Micavibrio sp.]|nr:MAG: ATPase [Micavibrio sp.]
MDDLIGEFLTETNEFLESLDQDLLGLEQDPNDKELLGNIFRLVHTIKGTCGFLGLPRLETVAHRAENVLGRFRDGDLEVTPEYVSLIFESLDVIKFIVGSLEETGSEPEGRDDALIAKLDAVFEGEDAPPPIAPPPIEEEKLKKTEEEESIPGMATEAELEAAFAAAEVLPLDQQDSIPNKEVQAEPPAAEEQKTEAVKKDTPMTTQTLRVSVDVLEDLMTMVSEMVLTRNQLLQILRAHTESDFTAPLQRLNHVVSELQEGVMKTRMQPIGNAWSKLPRIIRDLSIELGKKIDLEMRGQDTELDRQVLELIKDPLTHMVRNSGDHGIEVPADRVAAGKPETGKVLLHAFHEGGHIIIEISDDGKGLPLDKIKAKIISNGLATEAELKEMSSQQIQQYIFHAGLSTAEKVTSVSGRGVGMDVVRTNIEKIGGSIELKSTEGKGSTFTIKIPLTLAIVSALIVESAGQRFAIPQLSVRELVMTSEHGDNKIEMIKGTPVFRLRDRLLPLVSLDELLKLQRDDVPISEHLESIDVQEPELGAEESQKSAEAENHSESDDAAQKQPLQNQYVIVTETGAYDFGIIVDRVYDTEEIVVKPVPTILRDIDLFSGNTILGDGSVIMILDPNGVARVAGEIDSAEADDSAIEDAAHIGSSQQKTSLLLFSIGGTTPKAVPLSLVARLENVKISDIEHSSGQMMVQYRGSLMPLIPFDSSVKMNDVEEKPVLVFSDQDRSMGLIVDEIIDITEEHIDVQLSSTQQGLLGSAIINEKATDVVDVMHFLNTTHDNWFKNDGDESYGSAGGGKKRLLLVDDSPFFRNMLAPILGIAGYEVTTLDNAKTALKMCEDGAQFDVIVSDIEMPEMDGFEFAEKVKADSSWQNTPMIALTSHATPEDMDRGVQVGFTKHIAKFDKDTLLTALSHTLIEQQKAAQQEQGEQA